MFKRVAPAAAAIGILLFIIGCEIKNPAENLKLIISFSPVSTAVAVEITDPGTQEYVSGEVTIRFEGPDRAFVVDETGKSLSTMTTSTGIVSFAISDEVTPTPENPVRLFLVAEAEGYLRTGKTVLIQDTERQAVTVHLVSVQNPPPGAGAVTEQAGTTHPVSGTAASILVETPRTTAADLSARISIPRNTVITDGNRNPLSGALTASVVCFSGGNTEALQSFPGGFSVRVTGGSGGSEEGSFITAGFVAIEIRDESGKQAERFDPPIVVTMDLAPGQTDADGRRILAGDVIGIWSYDDQAGLWTHETDGVVLGPNANGRLYVEYAIRHLSFWQLGWFLKNHCLISRKIVLDGWSEEYGGVYLTFSANGYWRDAYLWKGDGTLLFNAPGFPVTIGAYAGGPRGTSLGTWPGRRLCGSGDLVLPVQVPAEIRDRMGKRIIHVSGICPGQDRLEVRPTAPIWFRKVTETNWTYAGMLKDGVLTINGLVFVQEYIFATSYEGQWYEAGFEITSASTLLIPEYSERVHLDKIDGNHIYYSVDLPDSVCDELNR